MGTTENASSSLLLNVDFKCGHEKLSMIRNLLGLPSTPSQMKTPIQNLSPRQLRHHRQTYFDLQKKFEELLLDSIAPGQTELFKELINKQGTVPSGLLTFFQIHF